MINSSGGPRASGFGTNIQHEIEHLSSYKMYGQVMNIVGLMIHVGGVTGSLSVGDHCIIHARNERKVTCEVVGFADGNALVMPFGSIDGIGMGARAEVEISEPLIYPSNEWLGRIINAFGEPVDGKGPLPS